MNNSHNYLSICAVPRLVPASTRPFQWLAWDSYRLLPWTVDVVPRSWWHTLLSNFRGEKVARELVCPGRDTMAPTHSRGSTRAIFPSWQRHEQEHNALQGPTCQCAESPHGKTQAIASTKVFLLPEQFTAERTSDLHPPVTLHLENCLAALKPRLSVSADIQNHLGLRISEDDVSSTACCVKVVMAAQCPISVSNCLAVICRLGCPPSLL